MNKLEQIIGAVVISTSLICCSTLQQKEIEYNNKQYISVGSDCISSMIIYLRGYVPRRPSVSIEYKDNKVIYKTE